MLAYCREFKNGCLDAVIHGYFVFTLLLSVLLLSQFLHRVVFVDAISIAKLYSNAFLYDSQVHFKMASIFEWSDLTKVVLESYYSQLISSVAIQIHYNLTFCDSYTRSTKARERETNDNTSIRTLVRHGMPCVSWWIARRIKSSPTSAACMRQWTGTTLVHIMACCLFGANQLSKPVLGC